MGQRCYARLRFAAGAGAWAFAGFFFVVATASRLFFSAAIKLTTLGGASTVGAITVPSRGEVFHQKTGETGTHTAAPLSTSGTFRRQMKSWIRLSGSSKLRTVRGTIHS
jgi:hypothetical protein